MIPQAEGYVLPEIYNAKPEPGQQPPNVSELPTPEQEPQPEFHEGSFREDRDGYDRDHRGPSD